MENHLVPVTDAQALGQLFTRSHAEPMILFKHSTTCPISAAAHEQMKRMTMDVGLVVVQSARDVSREVESRTGLRHESPQVIVLRNGEAVWSASHWDVTTDAVTQAAQKHA